jgi:hypothetical protein
MRHTTTNNALHVRTVIKKNWENIAGDRLEVIHRHQERERWMLWTFVAAVVVAAFCGYLIGKVF